MKTRRFTGRSSKPRPKREGRGTRLERRRCAGDGAGPGHTAAAAPGERAQPRKDRGIWRETNWREYAEHVRRFALGLASLGLERGDKVCIVGDNRPEWIIA